MKRPSVILSLLTAMFATEVSRTAETAPNSATSRPVPTVGAEAEPTNNHLEILAEARRTVGRELSKL